MTKQSIATIIERGVARRADHLPQAMGLEPHTCDRSFGGAESDSRHSLNGGEGCAVSHVDFYTFSLTTFAAMLPRARSLTRAHYYRTS